MAKKIGKGKLITELVKGSLEYTRDEIASAFRKQFGVMDNYGDMSCPFYIVDSFAEYVVVNQWSSGDLAPDEYFKVPYSKSGDTYTFATQDTWEVVELAYQPQTAVGDQQPAVSESKKQKKGKRIEENIAPGQVQLLEGKDEAKQTRRMRINDLMVADVPNGNKRVYSANVIEALVEKWRPHLRESAGQGRLKILSGEVEHPSDKGKKQAEYLETVVRWDTLDWDGKRLNIEGDLILTSKGKDVEILMEAGVNPGGSIRGYGESKIQKVDGQKVEVVEWVELTGADLVGDPSFVNVAELQESQSSMEDDMDLLEQLLKLRTEHPELFTGVTEAQLKKMGEDQLKSMEEKVRAALGIDANANITEALKATAEKARKFDESQKQNEVKDAITEATKDLPFGKTLNKIFVESFGSMEFDNPAAVKKFAESQRKQFSTLAASGVLKGMGFDEKTGRVQVVGDVLETETGTPEFGRAAFEITESIRKYEMRPVKDLRTRESRAAQFTVQLLERFDKLYQRQLMQEAQMFNEAEAASDLNLPYSVSRAIIAEAFPNLVAANVFDIGLMTGSPENIWFEAFAGESGYTATITDEVVTGGAETTWYALAHANVVPGTVVVTSNPAGTTWVEGTDFIIDYELGKILFLAAGGINTDDVLVDYDYNAVTQGEGAEIQQAKTTMSYQTITARAFRVADQINNEAIVFSRTQLGWDAVARTMANIIRETRRIIDRHLIEKALSASLSVASNSGGTWTNATDPFSEFAEKLGYAKVKVANRYYEPTAFLLSMTNSDLLSNWDGFTRLGFPNALLDAAGFVGGVKGLPVFATTQMRDGWGLCVNRQVVMHRVLQPMTVKGPFPTYGTNRKVIAADQYYSEEYNASLAPIAGKAAHIVIA